MESRETPVQPVGLTLLSDPPKAAIDIVFVHGLQGHPQSTWTLESKANRRLPSTERRDHFPFRLWLKDKSAESKLSNKEEVVDEASGNESKRQIGAVFWPRDLLKDDFPNARIMTFGYDTTIMQGYRPVHQGNIFSHAKNLLYGLELKRRNETKRDLVFIAHSLGGILVKEVLRRSECDPDHKINKIFMSTTGIFFFGTPHRGSEEWASFGEGIATISSRLLGMDMNATVIGALLPGSAELKLCQETFTTQWAKRRESLTVRTFQESKAVIGIRFGGINKLIVPPDSSTLEHPNERARTIDADHINMVKFSGRYDRTYEMVKGDIEELVRRAEEMAGRAVPDPAQSAYKDYEMQQRMSRTTVDAKTVHPPFSSIPLTVLPFGRNREFVGRKSQLDRLITTLHTNKTEDCPCIALVGLGGVGKTQIALECAFRLKTISPTCSVFWVRASDQMSFDDAYRDIGQQLHILELENDKADIKRLVKRRLSQESTGMWLMIIDSADDFEMFYNSNDTNVSGILSEYLPFSTLGAILFTTRDREAATRYTSSNVIEVDEMNNTDARELLRHSLQSKQPNQDEEGVTKLLKLLVNLPLAIMQAVAYLNTRECTITEYLRIYEESSDNVIKLLSQDFNDARRYPGIKNPVATTWFISFEQILVRDPLAADYIAFISCVKEQDIPRDLLPPASEFEQKEALYTLKAFRFINEHGAELYNMHRLVHLAAQQWLKLKDKWNSWNESALEQVARVFPFPQHENRALWMLYLPHAHCLIATLNMELKRTNETNQLIADLLHKLGECSKIKGNYATAEVMYRQALQLRETVLGKEHPDTLTSMSNLAVSLHWQGKYAVAEDIHRQTLHLREAVLEKDHPDTLTSMSNLALSLHWQGKYAAADTMHRQTLELRKKVLRRDHPDTLKSMNNLALSLHWQRKYAEAEAMHRDTLEIRIKELGKDHLETITSMSNLAVSLQWQKKYVEAETMHRRILDIRERVLGKDHPQTLTSMNNLALSRSWQGKYAEAEAMHQQTLQLRETVLGKEHPDTLTSMRNLALSLRRQGKNAKAEALQLHVLERRDEVLGGATHIR